MGWVRSLLLLNASPAVNRQLGKIYDKGTDWLITAGPRILFSAVILVAGLWLIRIIRRKINRKMEGHGVHSSLRPFIESLAFALLHVALGFLILQILGIRLTIFAAVIAAFGAAAGLALSGTLQNFASGVLILLLKPFKVGDNIIAQGEKGTVNSIQVFYTVILTFDNRTVIMPNSKLSNEVIINITREGVRRLDIDIKVKSTEDVMELKTCLNKAFSEIKEILHDPEIRIGVSAIGDDGYTITCNLWVNAHGFEDTRLMINERIITAMSRLRKEKEAKNNPQ